MASRTYNPPGGASVVDRKDGHATDHGPSSSTTRVLYIAGYGRSGSSIIEGMLQERLNATGVGELFCLWDRGFLKNELCSCGAPFRRCDFWNKVLRDAFGTVSEADAKAYDAEFQRARGNRPSPGLIERAGRDVSPLFRHITGALYGSLAANTGGRPLIDSSKFPLFASRLAQIVDVDILHLYRDPRAVANSWTRVKRRHEAHDRVEYMARSRSVLTSSWRWLWLNKLSRDVLALPEVGGLTASYEDFCDHPEAFIRNVGQRLGLEDRTGPADEWHSVSGNPNRFSGGDGRSEIRLDDAWKRDLGSAQQMCVSMLCGSYHRRLEALRAPV